MASYCSREKVCDAGYERVGFFAITINNFRSYLAVVSSLKIKVKI